MQSYSSPETNATFCPPNDTNIFGATMETHQKNRGGNQVNFLAFELQSPIADGSSARIDNHFVEVISKRGFGSVALDWMRGTPDQAAPLMKRGGSGNLDSRISGLSA